MNWSAKIISHKGEKRIAVYFEINQSLIDRIKKLDGSRWSQTKRVWHLPNTEHYRNQFQIILPEKKLPNPEGIQALTQFKQWLRSKRYSENTIVTYSDGLKSFLVFYNQKPIKSITNEDVIIFNNDHILKNNFSESYQNQIINAIKLYFKTIRETNIDIEKIHRPKRAKSLPNVLSKEEVKAILAAPTNLKHKMMLSLIYSCGLRCGELLALKPVNIDSKRNIVLLKNSKGKKESHSAIKSKNISLIERIL